MAVPLHFFDLTLDDLRGALASRGIAAYRADQVANWVYQHHTVDPSQMANLGKADRAAIAESLYFLSGDVVSHQVASDGVQKLLIQWRRDPAVDAPSAIAASAANETATSSAPAEATRRTLTLTQAVPLLSEAPDARRQTECVLIPADEDSAEESKSLRRTACISSQVGCPVGCRFCASGLGGLDGNLTAGRIVEQVWRLGALPDVGRVSHVVFMGMGEPLANLNEVVKAIRIITAPWALGISARRVTVSTVGLPAQIRRLADVEIPVTLAISLHAPNDEVRRRLIPWAEYVTIDQLLEAGDYYFEKTGREITLEYILLGGVNDQPEHARELAKVAKRLRANVNLIRYNEVKGLPFDRPGTDDVREFQRILRAARVNAHIRASRGRDIAAACGQLRHEQAKVM